ncbi:MAG: protein kinase [Gammaproteobacteria bacterium]
MSSLNKGQKIADRYVLQSRLHAGIHAHCWLAQDLQTRTQVVIKVAAATEDLHERLLHNEYECANKLNHPSVMRYFDHGTSEGLHWLTREYCASGELGSLRTRPWRQLVPIIAQLADALTHVHGAGLVHRDVKASNVLLGADGRARLTDFGIASVAGAEGLRSGGSPDTASPQQRDGAPPAPADDVWSLGLLIFDLVAGCAADASDTQRSDAWPGDAPDSLRVLATRMLHPTPAERPTSLNDVARALEAIVDADQNATLPPDEFVDAQQDLDAIEPLMPSSQSSSDIPLTPRDPGARRGVSRTAGVAALGVLIVAAFSTIYFLRTLSPVATPQTVVTQSGSSVGSTSVRSGESVAAVEPWKLAQEARLRDRAEAELEQLLDKQFTLEEKKVEVWALDDYEAAKQLAIDGDGAFRRQDFQGSFDAYAEGNALLGELVERSGNLIDENLRAGGESVEAGNSAAAITNYELVLKVEPGNRAAKNGLVRAGNIDQVIALVEQARELEQYGEPTKALALYREAAALDPKWTDAASGVRRVNRAMTGSRFSAAMSDGFSALSSDRFEAARAAFDRAENIRSGTSDVRDALAQLELARRSASVSSLQQRAQALEQQEDFAGALGVYREARALDPNLGFARDGETRNAERVELLETLNSYVDDPDRLMSDSVYDNAVQALDRARALNTPGRALTTASARLAAVLTTSRITAKVTLASDNLTDVLVYRVGRLGRFERQEVELRPGRYTAVGSRAGYRDVRREFRVGPGAAEGVVDVRCEERI